jgi:hypothetical protein
MEVPSLDGATVKATLDGRGAPASNPEDLARELTDTEVAESELTVREFLPGVMPSIVRSESYPDLYTADGRPLIGPVPGRPAPTWRPASPVPGSEEARRPSPAPTDSRANRRIVNALGPLRFTRACGRCRSAGMAGGGIPGSSRPEER